MRGRRRHGPEYEVVMSQIEDLMRQGRPSPLLGMRPPPPMSTPLPSTPILPPPLPSPTTGSKVQKAPLEGLR